MIDLFKCDSAIPMFPQSSADDRYIMPRACVAGLVHRFPSWEVYSGRLLIEDYAANGGDNRLTEDMLRQACGMKARVHDPVQTPGALASLDCGATPPEEKDSNHGRHPIQEATAVTGLSSKALGFRRLVKRVRRNNEVRHHAVGSPRQLSFNGRNHCHVSPIEEI